LSQKGDTLFVTSPKRERGGSVTQKIAPSLALQAGSGDLFDRGTKKRVGALRSPAKNPHSLTELLAEPAPAATAAAVHRGILLRPIRGAEGLDFANSRLRGRDGHEKYS
jgi:hypothetical protein